MSSHLYNFGFGWAKSHAPFLLYLQIRYTITINHPSNLTKFRRSVVEFGTLKMGAGYWPTITCGNLTILPCNYCGLPASTHFGQVQTALRCTECAVPRKRLQVVWKRLHKIESSSSSSSSSWSPWSSWSSWSSSSIFIFIFINIHLHHHHHHTLHTHILCVTHMNYIIITMARHRLPEKQPCLEFSSRLGARPPSTLRRPCSTWSASLVDASRIPRCRRTSSSCHTKSPLGRWNQ